MECLKGKHKPKKKSGNFRCTRCGGRADKKKNLCKPQKIKKGWTS